MSLFQTREWWQYRPNGDEECDTGCMCVINIDNNKDKLVKIVTGNFQGMLRIFLPHSNPNSNGAAPKPKDSVSLRNLEFSEDHVLFQTNLGEPILQLATGLFSSSVPYHCLAVLHPRRLVVYQVISKSSAEPASSGSDSLVSSDMGSIISLSKIYEHAIPRSAFNMCKGLFNTSDAANTGDSICVQSLDGEVYFFEQEHLLFSRYLPDFVAPGPLCYVSTTQSLVTVNSNMHIQSYSFQQLSMQTPATANDANVSEDPHSVVTAQVRDDKLRKVKPQWSVNLGDHAVSLFTARLSKSSKTHSASGDPFSEYPLEIVIVCEQSLLVLNTDGTLRFTRRLEYNPSFACAYTVSRSINEHKHKKMNMDTMSKRRNSSTMLLSEFLSEDEINQRNIDVDVFALQHILIGTHQRSLMIYKDNTLSWATRNAIDTIDADSGELPVLVQTVVAPLNGVSGMIIQLFDNNSIKVVYLGTDPPPMHVPRVMTGRDQEYQEMEAEHRSVLKKIKQLGSEGGLSGGVLTVTPKIYSVDATMKLSPAPGACAGAMGFGKRVDCVRASSVYTGDYRYCNVDIMLKWSGNEPISNLMISLAHSPGFICDVSTLAFPTFPVNTTNTTTTTTAAAGPVAVDMSTPIVFTIKFRCSSTFIPSSSNVTLTATFLTHANESRSQCSTFQLPLDLAVCVVPPIKSSNYILTLELNRSTVPPLNVLFPDLFTLGLQSHPDLTRTCNNIMSVQYGNDEDYATILVSKKGSRYRIQSSSMASMSLISTELVDRITLHHRYNDPGPEPGTPEEDAKFRISIQETPDVNEWYVYVQKHFFTKKDYRALHAQSEKLSQQYHAIERRMLFKYRDKTPQNTSDSGIGGMDILLKSTHTKLVAAMFELEKLQTILMQHRVNLSCVNDLLLLMIKYRYNLDVRNSELLKAYLFPIGADESCRCCLGVNEVRAMKKNNQAVEGCSETGYVSIGYPPSSQPPIVEIAIGETHEFSWEESLFATTSHLLRTSLSKDGESCSYTVQQYPKLEALEDPGVLLSNMNSICTQLGKGVRLYVKKEKDSK